VKFSPNAYILALLTPICEYGGLICEETESIFDYWANMKCPAYFSTAFWANPIRSGPATIPVTFRAKRKKKNGGFRLRVRRGFGGISNFVLTIHLSGSIMKITAVRMAF